MKRPRSFAGCLPLARLLLAAGRLPRLSWAVTRKRGWRGPRFAALRDDLRLLQGGGWRGHGEYRAVKPLALLAVAVAALYFVSPLDAIPDGVFGVGLVDDVAVLTWAMNRWKDELAVYRAWRECQEPEGRTRIGRLP